MINGAALQAIASLSPADGIVHGCDVTPCDESEKSSVSSTNSLATTERSPRPPAWPNGTGKTTLLELISALMRNDSRAFTEPFELGFRLVDGEFGTRRPRWR